MLGLKLSDPGTVIAPSTQTLTVTIDKPTFVVLKDISLKVTVNGSASFSGAAKVREENFSSIDGDFSKDYEMILDQTAQISTNVNIKAVISYYESKKRYWIFGDRIKTEEPTTEEKEISFTAVYTDLAPMENALSTCKAEKENLQKQIAAIQQEKQELAKNIEALQADNDSLRKYKTRFYVILFLIIAVAIGGAVYLWYYKFKR